MIYSHKSLNGIFYNKLHNTKHDCRNGTVFALESSVSNVTYIFSSVCLKLEVIPENPSGSVLDQQYCLVRNMVQRRHGKGLNQQQLRFPDGSGNIPSLSMNDKDLLQYVINLEYIFSRKQEKVMSMKSSIGTADRSRCIFYSITRLICQIRKDAAKLQERLERTYHPYYSKPRKIEAPEEKNLSYLTSFPERLTFYTGILNELLENIENNSWTSASDPGTTDLNTAAMFWINRIRHHRSFDSRIQIKTRFNYHIPKLPMRASELFQIIYHLVQNAIESLPDGKGGEIIVRTDLVDNHILFEVVDNGCGIHDETGEKILGNSYSTKDMVPEEDSHPGLNLYIAKNIVRECGGWIETESGRSIGSVFSVFLPIDQNPNKSSGSPVNNMNISPP